MSSSAARAMAAAYLCLWAALALGLLATAAFPGSAAAVRVALGLATLRLPARLAVWSIFRPRRYDTRLSAQVLETAARTPAPTAPTLERQLQP